MENLASCSSMSSISSHQRPVHYEMLYLIKMYRNAKSGLRNRVDFSDGLIYNREGLLPTGCLEYLKSDKDLRVNQ